MQAVSALQLPVTPFLPEATLLCNNGSALRHLLQCKVSHIVYMEKTGFLLLCLWSLYQNTVHHAGVVISSGMQLGPAHLTTAPTHFSCICSRGLIHKVTLKMLLLIQSYCLFVLSQAHCWPQHFCVRIFSILVQP